MRQIAFFLLSILLLGSCSPKNAEVVAPNNYPDVFQKVLKAHGGLDQWQDMNTFQFTKGTGDAAEVHTTDLKSRKVTIEKEGIYTLGFDGQHIWVSPEREAFPGKSPRFVHNLHFYFAALPFVLTDPGVTISDIGRQTVTGKSYHRIKATFGTNIGDAPEDQYILFIDPSSFEIAFINYSVTFFDTTKATQYNAFVYEWKQVNGLLAPTKYTGYAWENNSFGSNATRRYFPRQLIKKQSSPIVFLQLRKVPG